MDPELRLRIGNEVRLLSEEVSERYDKVYSTPGNKRFTFLAAQASLFMYLMRQMMERIDDWGWVPDYLKGFQQDVRFRYEDAREEDDHESALVLMARLRILSTLVRRISNNRRSLLFLDEAASWESAIGEDLHIRELVLTMQEAIVDYMRVEPLENAMRSRMAKAKIYLAERLLKECWDLKDGAFFADSIYDYIDSETERYRQARAAGDAENATAMLVRVRFSKTLLRRLDDPKRRAWINTVSAGSGTKH